MNKIKEEEATRRGNGLEPLQTATFATVNFQYPSSRNEKEIW